MKRISAILTLLMVQYSIPAGAQTRESELRVVAPEVVLAGLPFDIDITVVGRCQADSIEVDVTGLMLTQQDGSLQLPGRQLVLNGSLSISNAVLNSSGDIRVTATNPEMSAVVQVRVIPGFFSLLPPLLAILLAFAAKQVLLSLFCGIWLGATLMTGYDPFMGIMTTVDTFLVNSLVDPDHAAILLFSMTLGGMVGVISKAGGTEGIVEKLAQYAANHRGGQLSTWAMGLLIFFDDYANTLIVGSTMRPFTDRLRISREKLAYVVDSTAAPVASIALVSTWIGFQVGLINSSFKSVGISSNAYAVFLKSIPYASYSILALFFVFLVGITLRDFGPMATAEIRADSEGKLLRDGAQPIADSTALDMQAASDVPRRWYNALLPIAIVIAITLIGLYVSGKAVLGDTAADVPLGEIFGAANSFNVLMWASFAGLFSAGLLAFGQRILSVSETVEAAISGYKSMLLAAMILILAWAIGNICTELHTADYVIEISRGILRPHLLPVVTFIVAAFISFSTGSSWATMAILTPIVVPIAYKLPIDSGIAIGLADNILVATIGAVLSGSVLGDHCSPISDTTILSSMASASDHLDHVRTQIPYALSVAVVAIICSYLPSGWGMNPYLSLLTGAILLVALLMLFGRRIHD